MRRFIAGLVTASMLVATPVAFAGDHGRGGHGWRGGGGHGYTPNYRYSGYRHHHKNNDNNDDTWAWVLGGLLVGGLVTHAITKANAPPAASNAVYQEPYPPPAVAGRRMLRDLEGRCFEIGNDAAGNEFRTELPPSMCNW